MNWVTIIWSMIAAACLTLALLNLAVWFRQREQYAHLLFAVSAVAVAMISAFELALMKSQTPAEYATFARWGHVPVAVYIVAIVAFVRYYLRAGRPWLAWAACLSRLLALVVGLAHDININYLQITAIGQSTFLGDTVAYATESVPNPWTRLAELSVLILLVFLADATVTAFRRGDRQAALLVGGSSTFAILVAAVHAALVHHEIIESPYLISIPYLAVVSAMAFSLSTDVLRAGDLVRDLRAREAELRESEQRMDLAASAAGLALWVWEIASESIWMTERGRDLFGFGPHEHLNLTRFLSALHPDDVQLVQQGVSDSLSGGGELELEFRVVRPNGTTRWVSARGRVERNGAGEPVRMRGVSLDISARKQTEVELNHQRNELTHLSRVTLLGELSGSLAHELNQPLAAILSNAQAAQRFLAKTPPDLDEVRDILNDVVEQDQRASEVIRRLRLLLRKGEVQHLATDLNELVMDVLRLVRSDLVTQGVTVKTELASDLPQVRGDRVQLQQVLLNLMINGCDAMSELPIEDRHIVVTTGVTPAGAARVCVTDHGRGIAPAHRNRIFEPFFTTKSQGMGLGLAVCRTIVSAHHGTLEASSAQGKGATFTLALPVISANTDEPRGEGAR